MTPIPDTTDTHRGTMNERQLVVVAVTTTGYDPARHTVIEVAAQNLTTGRSWDIVAPLSRAQLAAADPKCLRQCGFGPRELAERGLREAGGFHDRLAELAHGLAHNTFAGSFPEFGAAFLMNLFASLDLEVSWHDRMADIGSLTAGAFGLSATTLPALAMCCRLWGIPYTAADTHSATTLLAATAGCFVEFERYTFPSAGAGYPSLGTDTKDGVVLPLRGRS